MVLRTCGSVPIKAELLARLCADLQTTPPSGRWRDVLIASVVSWAYRWWCYPGSSG